MTNVSEMKSAAVSAIESRKEEIKGIAQHILRNPETGFTEQKTSKFVQEQFRTMETLIQQGKIRYVGVSNFQAWQVMEALQVQKGINAQPLIAVQNPYSLMNRTQEDELFPMLRETGVGMMAYSPLGVGLLSGTYSPGQVPDDSTLWGSRRR